MKTWSVIDRLQHIKCSTLIITGIDDEAQDLCVSPYFEKIQEVKWIKFMKSSHTPMWEENERYLEVVGTFLAE